jgi:hypothetical protein
MLFMMNCFSVQDALSATNLVIHKYKLVIYL